MVHWTLKVVLTWFNDLWKFGFRNWLLDLVSQINVWKKKIAKVFILSLMSTHDFWNVHIHTQQSKLLQNKQWKKENIYQLRQSKFDHKIKNPKSVEIFHFFVGNFYVHNSILVRLIFKCYFDIIKEMYDSKVCSQKYLVSLVF